MRNLITMTVAAAALLFCACGTEAIDAPFDEGAQLNLTEPVEEEQVLPEETVVPIEEQLFLFPVQPAVHADAALDPNVHSFFDFADPGTIIEPADLSVEELVKIDALRDVIEQGLTLGRIKYIEQVSQTLQQMGVHPDYESVLLSEGTLPVSENVEPCPFAKYYDNGFEPSELTCDYLVNLAKVEVYSELSKDLDSFLLPESALTYAEEASFWHEQGAISGIEEQRTLIRSDLKMRKLCQKVPSAKESSYEKGIIVGRKNMTAQINAYLLSVGQVADYPIMSNPVQVCNANMALLLPAKATAMGNLADAMDAEPLCSDYVPPSEEGILQYNMAKIDYEKGMKEGISAEFAMAAVAIFKVIPCNVSDPVVIDLNGDGINLLPIEKGVNFDLYGIGAPIAVAWVSSEDGFLAMDLNFNGIVDNGRELFGNIDIQHADGFDHLENLERTDHAGNADGKIDIYDPLFSRLLIWQDANSDGACTKDEVKSLLSYGVQSIDLHRHMGPLRSLGIRIPRTSIIETVEGEMLFGDANLTSAHFARK